MGHRESLSKRMLWSAVGSLVSALGRIIAAIVIARELGPELAGQYAFFTWLVESIGIFAAFGLPATMSRYIAVGLGTGNEQFIQNLLNWITKIYAIFIAFGSIAIYIISLEYLSRTGETYLPYILSILLLLQSASALLNAYLSGTQNFRKLAKINLVSAIILVILQPICTVGMGLQGALLGAAFGYGASLIWLKPLASAALDRDTVTVPRSVIVYTSYTWLAGLVSAVVWARAEIFFLNLYSTHTQAGYFSISLTISSVVTMGATLLMGGLMPHFSTLVGKNDHVHLQQDYARFTRIVAMFTFPIGLGAAAVMPELVQLVFGSAYTAAAAPAAVVMISNILVFTGVGSELVYAHGNSSFMFRWGLIGALMVVVGCYLVTPIYGALGAAWIQISVRMLMIGIATVFIHWKLKIIPPYAGIVRIAGAAGMAALVANAVIHSIDTFSLVWAVAAGGATYILLVRIVQPLPKKDAIALLAITEGLPGNLGKSVGTLTRWIFRLP